MVPPQLGIPPESRLPTDNLGAWLDSGAGWAFIVPNPGLGGGLGSYRQSLVNPWVESRCGAVVEGPRRRNRAVRAVGVPIASPTPFPHPAHRTGRAQ
jgi:hypothetical protein